MPIKQPDIIICKCNELRTIYLRAIRRPITRDIPSRLICNTECFVMSQISHIGRHIHRIKLICAICYELPIVTETLCSPLVSCFWILRYGLWPGMKGIIYFIHLKIFCPLVIGKKYNTIIFWRSKSLSYSIINKIS